MGAYSQVRLGVYLIVCSGVCLRAYLGAYSQVGWEYAFECNWECLESLLAKVQSSRLRVCHRVQFRAS